MNKIKEIFMSLFVRLCLFVVSVPVIIIGALTLIIVISISLLVGALILSVACMLGLVTGKITTNDGKEIKFTPSELKDYFKSKQKNV